jgi:hypothetical protein
MMKYLLLLFPGLLFAQKSPMPSVKMPVDIAAELPLLPKELDYNIHVKPILSDKCFACHGPDKAKQKAGLRLDFAENAYAELPESPGKVAIKPKNLSQSELFHRIISNDPKYKMPTPKSHLSLTTREKATLIKWIQDGAVYQAHWAFVKPVKKSIPEKSNASASQMIDYYVRKKQEELGLKANPKANKELLLRRLYLDLTGLPPSLKELDAFLQDKSADAFEKRVDQLLKSPHFGEKMATDWLDIARFADSHGYTVDRIRDMSPYRDWVIKAFNQNMPYDKFIHYQLAGDLMPKPSKDMLIATAFNRNHQQNTEGGIVEEEFQTEYVMDRTNTFGDAFMALSVGCARCHDHKYDPISQKNYYELFSFFNNVREAGQISYNDDMPTPTMLLPTQEKEEILAFIQEKIHLKEKELFALKGQNMPAFETWLNQGNHQKLGEKRLPQVGLKGYYDFEKGLVNEVDSTAKAEMKHESGQKGDLPLFEKDAKGNHLTLDGDVYLDLNTVGVFRKSQPFTVAISAYIPKELKEGVILHKSNAERLYNFKGFHLYLRDGKLEITMAHTAPSNAITKLSVQEAPRNQWIHLALTYDGSSSAKGFLLFLNGEELAMETEIDQLYKDIIFHSKSEPAIQVGAWWRGLGFKGGKVDDLMVYNRALIPQEIKILAQKTHWESIVSKPIAQLSALEKNTLHDYFTQVVDENYQKAFQELTNLRTALSDSTENIPELMIMQERPKPKQAYLLARGQYDAPTVPVYPSTPNSILNFPAQLPKNRWGLAQWLTHEDHPLTSRVAVNRLWQSFFGTGLVKTSEDFGNQGEMPSHLELLDGLAVDFMQNKWDVKYLIKQMVLSETYQQDSKVDKATRELDPENRYLSRGPSTRLSAEMLRDNALAASGLLNTAIGGKSVKPYQPSGLWEINSSTYQQDTTDAIYRRSLYVIVKRTVPNPTLSTFDASARTSCLPRRQKTNTPLQALVALNDPTFVEASKWIASEMCQEKDVKTAIRNAYRKLTGVFPSETQVSLLQQLQASQAEKFKQFPQKIVGWTQTGKRPLAAGQDKAQLAANAVVASTILNSDATLMKR